jgi:plastocyanin
MRVRLIPHAILLPLVLAAACAQPGSTPANPSAAASSLSADSSAAKPSSGATVRFGNDTVGSPFPPPSGHDASGHGRDNLIPRTVVIDAGETVTFEMGGPVHQVGIYKDGTEVDQVRRVGAAPKAGCGPAPYIPGTGDPNLVTILGQPLCAGGAASVSYTFTRPGRYLVICTFIPHLNVGMYGWVEVRERSKP